MIWPELLQLLTQALIAAPELIKDVEQLLTDLKSGPKPAPMADRVQREMGPVEVLISTPIVK